MGLWFKKKPDHQLLVSFNQDKLKEEAIKNWGLLYEIRGETSWKIMMRQLDLFLNQEILNLSKVELSEKRMAVHRGVVDFISMLKITVDREFDRLSKLKTEKDKTTGYGQKVVGKATRRKTRPNLS